ncbi:hypothetical protein EJV47_24965 [Hymenobacter gummosus]|uniref:Lipoprotein n=1 Tax=Hymenobacter gummosus TaxID=1776032 RepID=A0A431TVI6_9BACT|nr:hypothetical protein [Hymenobacter gummosus]RTQ45395.1 hypothetical protein EJV47_24965 [Hymenobacter gummosus]
MQSSSMFLLRRCGLVVLGAASLSACQPADNGSGPPSPGWPTPPRPLMPPPPSPPPPVEAEWPDTPGDTLLHQHNGFYLWLAYWQDSAKLFRQLPALPPAPAGFRVSGISSAAGYEPLPRHLRLSGGLLVDIYHHEYLELGLLDPEFGAPDPLPRGLCGNEEGYYVNSWRYRRQALEFPRLRTAAGPLTALNRALQTRYELVTPNRDLGELTDREAGQPILPFELSAAALARRPWHREVDSSEAAAHPEMWRATYRLLDTTDRYQHYPVAISAVELGPGRRLLSLDDYYDNDYEDALRTSYYEDLAASSPAYYALQTGRRVRYADLFVPALSQDLWRAMWAPLRRERQRHQVPPLDSAATQDLRRQLAEPAYWAFTRRGLHAHYLGAEHEYEDARYRHARRYQDGFTVLIPYARLRPYLR